MAAPANLKPLTALRIFAALWVVLFDYWPNLGLATPMIVAKGYLGVELFFTLSGFILCHGYGFDATTRLSSGGQLRLHTDQLKTPKVPQLDRGSQAPLMRTFT